MKDKKHLFTYRQLHGLIYSQAIVPIVIYVMEHIKGKYDGAHRGTLIVTEAVLVLIFWLVNHRFYKMEKKDEMVQYHLAKANRITLYTLFAVIFIGVLLNDYFIPGLICADFCWLAVMGAIALRSLLYTFFDAPVKADEAEE